MLDRDAFVQVVRNTPLVAIELIVQDGDGRVLLGKRKNAPAKDMWFVPGGRIYKDETLDQAFSRTVREELDINKVMNDASFLGLYEHHYNDNFLDNSFSTHYVCIALKIQIEAASESLPLDQHLAYRWFSVSDLLDSDDVHQHTKDYFIASEGLR